MERKINVNWTEVKALGKRTEENVIKFEVARKKFQEIINSLPECWRGIDAENFKTSMNNYLNLLKEDTAYLIEWSMMFDKSSSKYKGHIEDGVKKMKSIEEEYLLPQQPKMIIPPMMGGMYDGQ